MNQPNITPTIQATTNDLSSLPYISTISAADQILLKKTIKHVKPNSQNYEDSWGYIIQATRYGGFKWYDPETGSLIFFGKKSESDPTLIVPSFVAGLDYLTYVVNKVHHALKAPKTILKNVTLNEITRFLAYGFRPYKKDEHWGAEARFDDQTFPQLVIDLKKTVEAKGKFYQKLRTALNKNPQFAIRKYRKTDQKAVLEIFVLKDGTSLDEPKRTSGMYFISHVMYLTAEIDKWVIIDEKSKRIIGFIATSDITSKHTAVVAELFKPDIKHASIWSTYQVLYHKCHKGFEIANLGGSETETTYNFKREKFRPVEELEKTHLIYE